VCGELLRQPVVGLVGLGCHQQAGRILVEAMHDAGPFHAADAGQAVAAMGNQGVDKGAGGVAGTGVHHQPGRFVDDDQAVVLEHDIEWYLLRFRPGRLRLRQAGFHHAAGFDPE
jgi:hypothetical protein